MSRIPEFLAYAAAVGRKTGGKGKFEASVSHGLLRRDKTDKQLATSVVRGVGMGRLVTKPFHSDDVTKVTNRPIRAALEKSHVGWVTQGDVTQGDVTQSRKGWRL